MIDARSEGVEGARSIGEVAEDLKLPQHVLRFWETRFPEVRPLKRAGGRRLYRPDDVALLRAIKDLLYGEGYTIKGVQRLLKDQGAGAFAAEPASPGHRFQPAFPPPGRSPAGVRGLAPPLAASAGARLAAVLADLAECARILAAARGADP